MSKKNNNIIKTTSKHFEEFKRYCLEHISKLGLHGWRIEFNHANTGNTYATCDHNIENRCAVITLTTEWDTDDYKLSSDNLRVSAKHEVHHLLLAKLAAYAAYRYVSKIQLDESEEEIIRILDKFL
jgi:hypothetical protein